MRRHSYPQSRCSSGHVWFSLSVTVVMSVRDVVKKSLVLEGPWGNDLCVCTWVKRTNVIPLFQSNHHLQPLKKLILYQVGPVVTSGPQ